MYAYLNWTLVFIQWFLFPFSDISKTQDDEVGDGTTSVVVFACELLRVSKIEKYNNTLICKFFMLL